MGMHAALSHSSCRHKKMEYIAVKDEKRGTHVGEQRLCPAVPFPSPPLPRPTVPKLVQTFQGFDHLFTILCVRVCNNSGRSTRLEGTIFIFIYIYIYIYIYTHTHIGSKRGWRHKDILVCQYRGGGGEVGEVAHIPPSLVEERGRRTSFSNDDISLHLSGGAWLKYSFTSL
jgi:hypothetical protein